MASVPAPKIQSYARLNKEVYDHLERQVGKVIVNRETTELQAGYQLGVQVVLQLLRDGYVINV
jgi:predicted GNAT family N-acyltransferase